MAKKGDYKIPFLNGSMMEYTSATYPAVKTPGASAQWYYPDEWRDNLEFDASVQMTGSYKGRSAARINVKNLHNGDEYSLGLSAFYEAVVAFGVTTDPVGNKGVITGRWTFRKQGANYGLYPVVP